jgi:hypothetical protein
MSSPDKSTDHIEPYSPDLVPVKGKDGWYRDPDSNAVVNCNKTEYDDYMTAYNKRKAKEESFKALQTDVDAVKLDLSEIKSLLKQIIVNGENHAS